MVGVSSQKGKLSTLTIDDDLAMGAYAITINSGGLIDGKDVSALGFGGVRGALARMRVNPATGTFNANPEFINDGNLGTVANASAVNQYAEILFDAVMRIDRYRTYGSASNNGTGRWTLQYLDPITNAWVDWDTAIACGTAGTWGIGWVTPGEVLAAGLKLICTTVDTAIPNSYIPELEVDLE
jgi:hypothetical protein